MKRRAWAIFLAVLLALSLTACGAGGNRAGSESASPSASPGESADYGGAASGTASTPLQGQKLIRRAELELETTAFQEAVQGLADLTERLGGYYESSNVGSQGGGYRWANYTVRVPAEQYQAFLTQAGELCHEVWSRTTQEDVSMAYYDTAGRLKTQQIKLERLQALLARAEDMEDIITVEAAISETEQAIDELSGTLRHYDGLVDYATVEVSLTEVYQLSNVKEAPIGFGSRMASAFASGWRSFTGGLESLAVALAYGWTWLVVLAVIAVVAVRVLRRRLPGGKKPDDKAPRG